LFLRFHYLWLFGDETVFKKKLVIIINIMEEIISVALTCCAMTLIGLSLGFALLKIQGD